MDSLNGDLGPVNLTYWPTCKNALAWSTDGLAVAAGEVVHILTPRDSAKPQDVVEHKEWHISTLRVNRFEQDEWPPQDLAPLSQFSLGEELSESTVVSIAWSLSGLGDYRRNVLGVLTSNLILSLWETNGRPGDWQRTCIVNQHLPRDLGGEDQDRVRLAKRVRGFTWLPSLRATADSRERERQILAVADDDYTVSFLEVRKTTAIAQGQWSVEYLLQHKLADQSHAKSQATGKQSLRSILSHSSPISALDAGEWQPEEAVNGVPTLQTLVIRISLGQCRRPECLLLRARHTTDAAVGGRDMELSIGTLTTSSELSLLVPPAEDIFEPALQKPRSELDRNYGLGGKVRVNYWGTAWSPKRTVAAACVSVHPSDMIEYGAPSTQRVMVLFVRMQESLLSEDKTSDPVKVQEGIFEFMVDASGGLVAAEFDKQILRNAAALMKLNFSESTDLIDSVDSWLEKRLTPVPGDGSEAGIRERTAQGDQMDVDGAETAKTITAEETCELCDSPIPFTSDFTQTRCNRGHRFSRCNLSFLAIQEPGISKYCSKCGRQFLDPAKMEFQRDGPSLSQALFDKFDVCPYCHGKFRG